MEGFARALAQSLDPEETGGLPILFSTGDGVVHEFAPQAGLIEDNPPPSDR